MSNNNTSESASPGSRFGLSNIFGLLISPSKRGGLPPPDPTNAEPTSHVNNGSNSAAMATGQTTAAAQTLRPIPGANINNHGGNNGSVSVTIGGSIITTTHRDTYHGAPAPHHVAPAPRPNPNNNNRNNKNNSIDAVDNQDTRNPKDLRYNEDDQKNFVIPDGLIPEKKNEINKEHCEKNFHFYVAFWKHNKCLPDIRSKVEHFGGAKKAVGQVKMDTDRLANFELILKSLHESFLEEGRKLFGKEVCQNFAQRGVKKGTHPPSNFSQCLAALGSEKMKSQTSPLFPLTLAYECIHRVSATGQTDSFYEPFCKGLVDFAKTMNLTFEPIVLGTKREKQVAHSLLKIARMSIANMKKESQNKEASVYNISIRQQKQRINDDQMLIPMSEVLKGKKSEVKTKSKTNNAFFLVTSKEDFFGPNLSNKGDEVLKQFLHESCVQRYILDVATMARAKGMGKQNLINCIGKAYDQLDGLIGAASSHYDNGCYKIDITEGEHQESGAIFEACAAEFEATADHNYPPPPQQQYAQGSVQQQPSYLPPQGSAQVEVVQHQQQGGLAAASSASTGTSDLNASANYASVHNNTYAQQSIVPAQHQQQQLDPRMGLPILPIPVATPTEGVCCAGDSCPCPQGRNIVPDANGALSKHQCPNCQGIYHCELFGCAVKFGDILRKYGYKVDDRLVRTGCPVPSQNPNVAICVSCIKALAGPSKGLAQLGGNQIMNAGGGVGSSGNTSNGDDNNNMGAAAPPPPQQQQYAQGAAQHKILQQWEAQGDRISALLGTTPTELAIMNSIRTASQEEEHRAYLYEIGKDLQHLDDDMLNRFDDRAYMIELKRAYRRGVLQQPSQGQKTQSVLLTDDCSTTSKPTTQKQSKTKKNNEKSPKHTTEKQSKTDKKRKPNTSTASGSRKKNDEKSPIDQMVTQAEELSKVQREKILAYHVDDPKEKNHYLAQWIGPPFRSTKTEIILIGPNSFPVEEGDWLLKGQWLEKLTGGKNWYTMTLNHGECVVRLQSVLNLDVTMPKYGVGNDFNKGTRLSTIKIAEERGAYRMDDEVRKGLIDECQKRDCMQEDQDSQKKKRRKVCF